MLQVVSAFNLDSLTFTMSTSDTSLIMLGSFVEEQKEWARAKNRQDIDTEPSSIQLQIVFANRYGTDYPVLSRDTVESYTLKIETGTA